MAIYAVDPGPHTGIFWIDDEGQHRVTLDYSDGLVKKPLWHLYTWLMQMMNPKTDQMVLESFEFRKEDAHEREYIDYSTGEFVGVCKLYCDLTETPCYVQSASEGKGFWDDDKLKRVGLYVTGKEQRHVRDATRHWLHHVTFRENNDYYLKKLK